MFYQHAGRVNSDVKCLACTVPPSLHAKRFLLVDLITIHSQAGKTIVFCNTKRECEAVVSAVSGIMPAEALHGDIAQDMREYTMSRFREVCFFLFCFGAVSMFQQSVLFQRQQCVGACWPHCEA